MNKIKFQKGITLIALIITVILLLILSAVTIGSVKENDIIGYAQNAAEEYEEKQKEEQGKISEYKEQIKDVLGSSYVTGTATVGTIVSKNSTINGNVPSSNNPVIPAGFKAVNITTEGHESNWNAEGGPEVNEGLVIEDEDKNQFVWIPVADTSEFAELLTDGNYMGILYSVDSQFGASELLKYKTREPNIVTYDQSGSDGADTILANLQISGVTDLIQNDGETIGTINEYDFKEQLQNEFNEMVKSVAKYGGFYVGRYETTLSNGKAQSKEGQTPMNNVTWYEIYRDSKTYSTSGVISEMIWGCQYDAMLKFILTGNEKYHVDGNGSEYISSSIPGYLTGGSGYTGSVQYNDIASNIYDLSGNVSEWTQESYSNEYRAIRGGSSEVDVRLCERMYNRPETIQPRLGSRLALYVEV